MNHRSFAATLLTVAALSSAANADEPPLAIPVDGVPPTSAPPQPPPQPPQQPLAIPGDTRAPPTIPLYTQGYQDGREAARGRSAVDWALVGAGSTCVLSVFGCLGATTAGATLTPNPPSVYFEGLNNTDPRDNDYWMGYRQGYDRTLRSKRAMAAFAGGSAVVALSAVALGGLFMLGVIETDPETNPPPPNQPQY